MRIDNFLALTRQIKFSQNQINRVLKQLASQKAINSFSDDPVGSAALVRLKSSLNSLKAANEKNIVQAEALTSNAEDVAQQIADKIKDLKAIAQEVIGGASGSSNEELDVLFQEGLADIEALVTSTEFNGQQLFDGDFETKIQVGDQSNETYTISWSGLSLAELGISTDDVLTVGGAEKALAHLETASTKVGLVQSKISATQTSLDFRSNANALEIENLEEARSKIEDLDVAEASVRLAVLENLYESQLTLLNSSLTSQSEAFRLLFLKNY